MSPEIISMISELSATAVVFVILFLVFRYLTSTLSKEIQNLYDIVVKLIDKTNDQIKESSDNADEITDMLHRIEGMLDIPPQRRRR
jgi:predicted PurR-regulated permease PerM